MCVWGVGCVCVGGSEQVGEASIQKPYYPYLWEVSAYYDLRSTIHRRVEETVFGGSLQIGWVR